MKNGLNLTMLTDFYEITMSNGYFEHGLKDKIVCFDMFFRRVPDNGGYAVVAGLEQIVEYIQNLHFDEDDIEYLRSKNVFDEGFLQSLKFKNPEMQKHVCTLVGKAAKFKGKDKKWWKEQKLYWQGKEYSRNSQEIQQVIDMVEEKSGNQIDMIMCSVGVRNKVLQLLNSKTYYAGTVNLEGGFRSISFNGIPLVTDRFCPKGTMYLLNTKDFSLNQLCDWQWLEDDNGKILKQKPGKPIYTATLVKYADLLCANPSGQGALVNIKED